MVINKLDIAEPPTADAQPVTLAPTGIPRAVQALLETPYARYLELATLYDVQVAEHGDTTLHHAEEVVFRSVHMVSELWLRLAAFELERVGALLDGGRVALAARLVRRAEASRAHGHRSQRAAGDDAGGGVPRVSHPTRRGERPAIPTATPSCGAAVVSGV